MHKEYKKPRIRKKYLMSKGLRVKKGTVKIKGQKYRVPFFDSLTVLNDYLWWCDQLNKWIYAWQGKGFDYCSNNLNIHNVKQAIRHIKNHPELPKGTKLMLCSNFKNGHITFTVL